MTDDCRWLRFYGSVPHTLKYPEITLYEAIAETAARLPDAIAWDFFGTTSTYAELLASIDRCADVLASLGLKQDERLLISMPTSPQGVIAFYAANKLGVVPAMIHPLSTAPEIEHYLNAIGARTALTLNAFYSKFAEVAPRRPLKNLILARIPDYLSPVKGLGFWVAKGRKIPSIPDDPRVRWWTRLMRDSCARTPRASVTTDHPAAIMFSGGTTGAPKGILLSNRSFIAEGMQVGAWVGLGEGESIIAVLPIFHGFGLAGCINAFFLAGAKSILVPTFDPQIVAKLLCRKRATILAGPPTLFAALAKNKNLAASRLTCLRVTASGADRLPHPVSERFNRLMKDCGSKTKLREGYGLTETVTGIMLMPLHEYREGSIGIPFPDVHAKICKPGTTETAMPNEEGEICITGPSLMLGYLDDPAATAEVMKVHADGRTWLHTGDLGKMDEDGFFYFIARLKRMIKSSGFNIYPDQIETVLYQHTIVAEACVVGVPDPDQIERVKAFVVLKDRSFENPETEQMLIEHCRKQLIKWSCPREIEFRSELPKTRIGKVDYKALMREHIAAKRDQGLGIGDQGSG